MNEYECDAADQSEWDTPVSKRDILFANEHDSMSYLQDDSKSFRRPILFVVSTVSQQLSQHVEMVYQYALGCGFSAQLGIFLTHLDCIYELHNIRLSPVHALVFDVEQMAENSEKPLLCVRREVRRVAKQQNGRLPRCVVDGVDATAFWDDAGVPRVDSVRRLRFGGLDRALSEYLSSH